MNDKLRKQLELDTDAETVVKGDAGSRTYTVRVKHMSGLMSEVSGRDKPRDLYTKALEALAKKLEAAERAEEAKAKKPAPEAPQAEKA